MRTFQTFDIKFQPEFVVDSLTSFLKCPHGLDNVIIIWWNLVIVRDNSAIARTTLRGLKFWRVVSNNKEISSNNDNVVQARRRFVPKMGWVADGPWMIMLPKPFWAFVGNRSNWKWFKRNVVNLARFEYSRMQIYLPKVVGANICVNDNDSFDELSEIRLKCDFCSPQCMRYADPMF